MTFRVGQEVVCVDASGNVSNLLGERFDTNELTKGAVYTIRSLGVTQLGDPGVRLVEIDRRNIPKDIPLFINDPDAPFRASRFRPVVKTDISIFTSMLAPSPKKVAHEPA